MRDFSRLVLATAVASVLAVAQEPAAFVPTEVVHGLGTEPVPGQRAGTFRYNVTFASRPFDLTTFRTAIQTGANAEQVAAIVSDLQQRTVQNQAPFAAAIAALGEIGRAHV